MGASSGFPIDLILFGMIAAFLVLRLRSILGRRTGFERQAPPYQPPAGPTATGPVIDGQAERPAATVVRVLPEPASTTGQALAAMGSIDRSFDPTAFLDGAEKAFRIIVAAFASGDRATLRGLLSDDTYHAFDQAIAAREASGQTQVSAIHGMHSAGLAICRQANCVAMVSRRSDLPPGHPLLS